MLSKNKIKQIVGLSRKKNRDNEGLFLAEGIKTIGEFIQNGFHIRYLVCLESYCSNFGSFAIETIGASPEEMKKISLFSTPSVAVAVVEKPEILPFESLEKEDLMLALDGIQDPGNLGTIIRLCSWFGIQNMFCSFDTADCFNPKSVQATMGALAHVSVNYCHLQEFLKEMNNQKIPIYGTFLEGQNLYQQKLSKQGIVVLGNEGHGIRPELAPLITRKIFIPPYHNNRPSIESLNVSMAASIVISEFRRTLF